MDRDDDYIRQPPSGERNDDGANDQPEEEPEQNCCTRCCESCFGPILRCFNRIPFLIKLDLACLVPALVFAPIYGVYFFEDLGHEHKKICAANSGDYHPFIYNTEE